MNIHESSRVLLITPDNPRLDGASGFVSAITDWGAHVLTDAAATGRFRAAWQEMVPWGETNGSVSATVAVSVSLSAYTGDVCPTCGGSRMVRRGTCSCCEDCGTTTGCS